MTDTTLRQALAYARHGWPVFPCLPGQKVPATRHGYRDATTDQDRITAWFGRGRGWNLAIATGAPGPDVLDVDQHGPAGNGYRAFNTLRRADLVDGGAAYVRTPAGGMHAYFTGSDQHNGWVEDARQWQPIATAGFDHDKFAVYVWRSVRAGGDTKTQKSRRTLEVPDEVARALRQHHTKQAARRLRAGETWQDNDLVFCTRNGKPLAAGNVRRAFRSITNAACIGEDWTPRELRHTFVSIMSDNDVPIETIADLVGHRTTIVTQTVYRHQLRPVIETGATAMNTILKRQCPVPGDLSH
jgi:integrase